MNRMRNKTTNTLESELRKLISKPSLTIDEFKRLIPMLISDDREVVRLGIELLKHMIIKVFLALYWKYVSAAT